MAIKKVLEKLVNDLEANIFILDKNYKIVFVNDSAKKIFEHYYNELYNLNFFDLFHEKDIKKVKSFLQNYINKSDSNNKFFCKIKFKEDDFANFYLKIKAFDDDFILISLESINNIDISYKKQFFDELSNNTLIGFCIISSNNYFEYLSPSSLKLIGYKKLSRKISFKEFKNIVHPEDLEKIEEAYKKIFQVNNNYEFEYRILTESGEYIWVKSVLISVYEKNNILYAELLNYNITNQKAIDDTRKKYEFIVNASTDLMTLINRNYIYEAANDEYCNAHGMKREEIIGSTVSEIWGVYDFNNIIKKHLDDCFSGKMVQYRRWIKFRDLEPRFYDIKYYPYYDSNNNLTHAVVISRDITDTKIINDKLEESQKKLKKHFNAFLEIVNKDLYQYNDINFSLKEIAEITVKCIEIERISIWNAEKDLSQCSFLYDSNQNYNKKFLEFNINFDRIIEYIKNYRILTIQDTKNSEFTQDLYEKYFKFLNIRAAVISAIWNKGKIKSLIFFEQRNDFRDWTIEEQTFLSSIADFISLLYEANSRKIAENALKEAYNELEKRVKERTSELLRSNELLVSEILERKKIERKLLENQRIFTTLLSNLPGIVYRIKKEDDWKLEFLSSGCHELTGYSSDYLIDKNKIPFLDLIHPEEKECIISQIQNSINNQQSYELNYRIIDSQNNEKWVWDKGKIIFSEDNKNYYYLEGFITDITEKRNIEKIFHLTQLAIENSQDAFLWLTWDGKIIYANSIANKLLASKNNNVIGLQITEFFGENFKNKWKNLQNRLLKERQITMEVNKVINDDKKIVFEKNISLNFYNNENYIFFFMKDITNRKEIEDKQKELIKELEIANSELRDFAHIVSHDLKNPLRAINFSINTLTQKYNKHLDDEDNYLINMLKRKIKLMDKLISGILHYSKIGYINEKKVNVNLNTLIADITELLIIPKNITLKIASELPTIYFEKTKIKQIFQNLLSNAIKYNNKEEGIIIISHYEDENFWYFKVTDNGMGIRKDYFDKIFNLFHSNLYSEEDDNTGIGLAIVKKIIETSGGKISVESEINEGTTFSFQLPKKIN